MAKLFSGLKWGIVLVILGVLTFVGVRYLGHHGQEHPYNGRVVAQEYHMQQMPSNHGDNRMVFAERRINYEGDDQDMRGRMHHSRHGFPWVASFLIGGIMVVGGWMLVKRSQGNRVKKWIGVSLILLALLPLIGPLVGIAAVALLLLVTMRILKKPSGRTIVETVPEFYDSKTKDADFLDEWEKQVMNKKNNKGDVQ